jgi:hypothetical protein
MREVWVIECWPRADYDGDGIAERRQVLVAGDENPVVLANEEVDGHPFATLTPNPMPHRLVGLSLADQAMDLQFVKSVLWRGALDAIHP